MTPLALYLTALSTRVLCPCCGRCRVTLFESR